jgi:Asp-tRNAAsn/Glu-tRNAGln amidotransferase A subunit and related amidases
MSNLTGISFGVRKEGNSPEEIMKNHRTTGFSSLIKRRFVIGSFVLQSENQEKYFLNAKRVRRLIVNKLNELFDKYDAMIMPVSIGTAKYLDTSLNNVSDEFKCLEESLQLANFGGYPSITIPNGFINGLPTGVNFTCKIKDDENLLSIAYAVEEKMNYKNQIVGGVK